MHGVVERILAGGGDSGVLARSVDWSGTAIGGVEQWPQALRSAAALVLHNDSPMLLWWGPEFIQIYNDAYRPVLGDKHPRAMGQPLSQCWAEVFEILRPMVEKPLRGGGASSSDDLALLIDRKVRREDSHFRVSYSPVPDDTVRPTGVGGVLATVTEITEQVYGDRQLRTLRELGVRSAAQGQTTEQACAAVVTTLEENPWDVPFALLYLLDADGEGARLAASAGFGGQPPSAAVRLCPWPLGEAARERRIVTVDDLSSCADALPHSPWSDRLRSAIVLPLASPEQPVAQAVLVCGVSPHRVLDAGYRGFFELVAGQAVTALRNAQAQVPVIVLSARAGEEARVDGLDAGADDYLVKPFSAKELLARVRVQLENGRLRRQFSDAHRQAEAAREIAESASRAKDEFLAMLGHELRNPLSPIVTALQLLRMRGTNTREQAVIERQVAHLVRLVDDLLDISRITRGKIELRRSRTEAAKIILRGMEIAGPLLEQRRINVNLQVPAEGLAVNADPERMAQVVSNLLTNAAKYSEMGTVVHISAHSVGKRVQIRVRDEGMGIEAPLLGKVFDMFFQPPQSLDRATGGLGLGLAIVRSLVEMHGGAVFAMSDGPGKGSEFVVELPLDAAPSASAYGSPMAAAGAVPEQGGLQGKRILVVDDNTDAAESMGDLLEMLGNSVAIAHDGAEALRIVPAFHPEVCIVDIGLPAMDGYELARRLRESDCLAQGARLIAVTGYGQPTDQQRSAEAGFDAHLVKPVNPDLLTRSFTN